MGGEMLSVIIWYLFFLFGIIGGYIIRCFICFFFYVKVMMLVDVMMYQFIKLVGMDIF